MMLDVAEIAKRMLEVRGIDFAQDYSGWHARVAGTGLEVREIMKVNRECDENWDRLTVALCHLTKAQLQAALAYYRLYPDEIDEYIANEEAIEEGARREGYPTVTLQPKQ